MLRHYREYALGQSAVVQQLFGLGLAATLLLATGQPGQAQVQFAPAQSYPIGGRDPEFIGTGDLNGDGLLDLAVANEDSRNVSVLLGTGGGVFGPSSEYNSGNGSVSLAFADFDRDGDLDLAIANRFVNTIVVLANDGNGAFPPTGSRSYATGQVPVSVVAGDFDGDGDSDLAAANYLSDSVSVLKNSGTGSFAAAQNFGTGDAPRAIAAGDFNGDGRLDLSTADLFAGTLTPLINDGSGAFGAGAVVSVGGNFASSVAVADFDGDGDLDLATANLSNTVSILLGDGQGGFTPQADIAVAGGPFWIVAGDLDGDGDSDLVTANRSNSSVGVLLGNGNGTFAAPLGFAVGSTPYSVVLGDFNRDNDIDIATVNEGNGNISVLLQVPVQNEPTLTLTNIAPKRGRAGTVVTLTGTGLSAVTAVTFAGSAPGGIAAAFNIVSDTEIQATVPEGAVTGPITVVTPAGSATSASFRVTTGSR